MHTRARVPGALVLTALFLAGIGSLATPAPVAAAWTTATYSTADEDMMLTLVNQARASAGLPALIMDARLRGVAESRSSDFVTQRYFGHSIPAACNQVFTLLQQQGIQYAWAAENIGWNTYADDQATQWQFNWFMGSSTHKANILSTTATKIGIGAFKNTWTYGTACGQSGNGLTYQSAKLYALVFIKDGDAIPPTVSAPSSKLYASTGGTASMSVRTTWTQSDAGGLATTTLERSTNGGAYAAVSLGTPLATTLTQTLSDGVTYRYRVRAKDLAGNSCASVYGPSFKPSRVEQSSTSVVFGGSWTTTSTTSASGGSYRYASTAGASASWTTSGTSLGWMALKGPSGGSVEVYVDGALKGTLSLYAATTSYRPIVYVYSWSSQGTRTIKIVAKGTGRIYLDAFVKLANV